MQINGFQFPFELLEPWEEIQDGSEPIVAELKKEVREDGILYDVAAQAIARRVDCDDVLFKLEGKKEEFAVVHLTWSGRRDPNPGWPSTTLYSDIASWNTECMIPDHEDYTC